MKIEETETGMRLIAENDWEREKLKTLRRRNSIDKMTFQDDWDSVGPLTLHYPTHPWDQRR